MSMDTLTRVDHEHLDHARRPSERPVPAGRRPGRERDEPSILAHVKQVWPDTDTNDPSLEVGDTLIDLVAIERAAAGDRDAWRALTRAERWLVEGYVLSRSEAERQQAHDLYHWAVQARGYRGAWEGSRDERWVVGWAASVGEDYERVLGRARARRKRGRWPL